jgi:methionine-gamma-lyase
MRPFDPATRVQDYLVFGEFGDVNPSITDSSTYTFLRPETMEEVFDHEIEGCFLYSRHWNPTNRVLADALARMEDGEGAVVTSSGMAAIATTLMLHCSAGDDIVASRTIYGGTYALMKNLLPRFGITTRFVDTKDLSAVRTAIGPRTKVLYCEAISNPLLEVNDLEKLAAIAKERGAAMIVDNTFSPMIISPLRLGADVVVHSMTKFINGTSDCVAGCVVGSHATVAGLMDITQGPAMLFGPTLDAFRAASILKNLHSLHVRLKKHAENALELARHMAAKGLKVHYPGLPEHPQHALLAHLMNPGYGYGGMLVLDAGTEATANRLMMRMQQEKVGYLAVSLGYFKTLFSSPGHSTSSEIPVEEQDRMGLSGGLIRFSIGLDQNIERTWETIERCLREVKLA